MCENDLFEIDPIAPQVKHAFGAKRGRIIGAYAACFHKQRRPVVCFAPLEEYRKDSPTWKTYPSAMIVKVAEALSLKRQFGISGLVTAEEIDGASEAPETTRAGKAPTEMTSVVEVVHGPVVECPPTAAGSPDQISSETPALEATAPLDVKRMKEEFARMEEHLGRDKYTEILMRHGVRAVPAIRSLVFARRVYREMLAELKASANREGN